MELYDTFINPENMKNYSLMKVMFFITHINYFKDRFKPFIVKPKKQNSDSPKKYITPFMAISNYQVFINFIFIKCLV